MFKSTLTETVFSRKKKPQENAMKIIRAKNTLKTEGQLYRNNFGTLEITDNRLRRKFFQMRSVIAKAFPTHLPVISINMFQDGVSRTSLGNPAHCLTACAVGKFFPKSPLILQFKLFTSGLTCVNKEEKLFFFSLQHTSKFLSYLSFPSLNNPDCFILSL